MCDCTVSYTGVVSENMQGLGAKLRKLPGQAKICTPPGGEVIAKICVLRFKDLYSRIETSLRTRHMSTIFPSRRLAAAAIRVRVRVRVRASVGYDWVWVSEG